ncbi:MAG: HPr family phosphocarrier protein [Acidobacteria bacterium]|nr:MAG: HPr family phosphocarrier protein [Acidobacteriota bacterium]
MTTLQLRIINKLGLHARAAAKVVHLANEFNSEIFLGVDGEEINAKSILGLLTLAATQGTPLTLRVVGPDEAAAVAAIQDLFENRFGEGE